MLRASLLPVRPRSDDKGHIETTNVTGNLDLFWAIIRRLPRHLPSPSSCFSCLWFPLSAPGFEEQLCQGRGRGLFKNVFLRQHHRHCRYLCGDSSEIRFAKWASEQCTINAQLNAINAPLKFIITGKISIKIVLMRKKMYS